MSDGARYSISGVRLFADLNDEQADRVSRLCHWSRVPKGLDVVGQDEKSTDIFFVKEGRVAAKGLSSDGKEVIYTEIREGDLFGEFSAIDRQPRSATIHALADSLVARMSSEVFRTVVVDYPNVGLRLLELLVAKNRNLTMRVFEFSTMAVRQRICAELLRLAEQNLASNGDILIQPAPSHYEIATRLSTHREAVSKEIAHLARLGIIDPGRRKIRVLDIEKLRAEARF